MLFLFTNTIHIVQGERFKSVLVIRAPSWWKLTNLSEVTVKCYEQGHGTAGLLWSYQMLWIWTTEADEWKKNIVFPCHGILNVNKNRNDIQPLHFSFHKFLVWEILPCQAESWHPFPYLNSFYEIYCHWYWRELT